MVEEAYVQGVINYEGDIEKDVQEGNVILQDSDLILSEEVEDALPVSSRTRRLQVIQIPSNS